MNDSPDVVIVFSFTPDPLPLPPNLATAAQVDDVINSLRNFITDDTTLVLNVPELLTSTATATNSILLFFYVGTSA